MKHVLKVWPQYAQALTDGSKNFEIRDNFDRGFQKGDELELRVFDPVKDEFTGDTIFREVTYVHSGLGLQKNFVVLGLKEQRK